MKKILFLSTLAIPLTIIASCASNSKSDNNDDRQNNQFTNISTVFSASSKDTNKTAPANIQYKVFENTVATEGTESTTPPTTEGNNSGSNTDEQKPSTKPEGTPGNGSTDSNPGDTQKPGGDSNQGDNSKPESNVNPDKPQNGGDKVETLPENSPTTLYLSNTDGTVKAVEFNGKYAVIDDVTYAGNDYLAVKIDELYAKGKTPKGENSNPQAKADNDEDKNENLETESENLAFINLKTGVVSLISDKNFTKQCNDIESFEVIDGKAYFTCENNVLQKDLSNIENDSTIISTGNNDREQFDDANVIFLKDEYSVIKGLYASEDHLETVKVVDNNTEVNFSKEITELPENTFKDGDDNLLFFDKTSGTINKLKYFSDNNTLSAEKLDLFEFKNAKDFFGPITNENGSSARFSKLQYFISENSYYQFDVLDLKINKVNWKFEDFEALKTASKNFTDLEDELAFIGKDGIAYTLNNETSNPTLKYIKFEKDAKPIEIKVNGCSKFDDLSIIEDKLYFECESVAEEKTEKAALLLKDGESSEENNAKDKEDKSEKEEIDVHYSVDLSTISDKNNNAKQITSKNFILKVINVKDVINSSDTQKPEPEKQEGSENGQGNDVTKPEGQKPGTDGTEDGKTPGTNETGKDDTTVKGDGTQDQTSKEPAVKDETGTATPEASAPEKDQSSNGEAVSGETSEKAPQEDVQAEVK